MAYGLLPESLWALFLHMYTPVPVLVVRSSGLLSQRDESGSGRGERGVGGVRVGVGGVREEWEG